MTPDQSNRTGPREIGPGRFQRPETEAAPRRLAASLGAGALLLALVVGVPTALIALGGTPSVPGSWPTRSELMATIGVEQLLAVLVWVVWIAWLQFTLCVAVELRSALSGIGLPSRVPMAGPSQRLARTLVVTLLLVVTAAGQATAAVGSALPDAASTTSISATVLSTTPVDTLGTGTPEAAPAAVEQAVVGETTYWLGDVQLSQEEGAELLGQRVYVVQPPDGRYHDNLWDISERALGGGRRYQEVFELNKGRDQPDGQALTLERLIYPGWLLVMPEDATAVERVTAVVTPVETPVAAPVAAAPVQGPDEAVTDLDAAGDVGATSGGATAEVHHDERGAIGGGLVGAGLLAAGLVVAVDRLRRRRATRELSEDAVELEVALRVGADPDRALLLDRGLRRLGEVLRSGGRDLPAVLLALVDEDGLELRLSPPSPDAPTPWRVLADGRTWRLDSAEADLSVCVGAAPFPGLVSVGRDLEGRDVLIDLEAAQGPVAILGDPRAAVELATAIAVELATNRWSDRVQVTGVDLPRDLEALPAERYLAAPSLDEVLPRLQERRAEAHGDDVLTGRARADGTSVRVPEYLVVGTLPPAEVALALAGTATTEQRSALGVLCVGDLPGARWQLLVDGEGRVTSRLLGIDVRGNRLSVRQLAAVSELLAPEPEPERAVDERHAAIHHEGAVERPPVTPPSRPVGREDLEAAAVRVHLLGEPRVESGGTIDEARRATGTELVAFLALHPDGVHTNVVSAALWPRGVTAEVREGVLSRVTQWLGHDATGTPHLVRGPDGHLSLGPGVVVDWDVVRTLLARSRSAPDRLAERADLHEALGLARGAVLSARPTGRYAWLARVRLERASRALLVDAVHRLVVLCRDDGDPAAAQSVAWRGLAVAPVEELLWRDLLRAASELGGPAAARDVAADLGATLRAAGTGEVSAATEALLEELAAPVGFAAPRSV